MTWDAKVDDTHGNTPSSIEKDADTEDDTDGAYGEDGQAQRSNPHALRPFWLCHCDPRCEGRHTWYKVTGDTRVMLGNYKTHSSSIKAASGSHDDAAIGKTSSDSKPLFGKEVQRLCGNFRHWNTCCHRCHLHVSWHGYTPSIVYRSANKSHAPEVLDFTSRSFTMKWHVSSWGNNGEGRSELTEEDLLENNSLLWRREATAPLDEPKLDDHEFDGW